MARLQHLDNALEKHGKCAPPPPPPPRFCALAPYCVTIVAWEIQITQHPAE